MKNIFKRRPSREDFEEDRKKVEEYVRQLWGDEVISLEELIYHADQSRKGAFFSNDNPDRLPIKVKPKDSEDFIVFIDRNIDLDWITDFPLENDQAAVIAEIAAIENNPCESLRTGEIISFKRILGAAATCALEGNCDEARRQNDAAKNYHRKRVTERSRRWILNFSIPFPLFLLVIIARYPELLVLSATDSIHPVWLTSACFAIFGAFISIIQRSGKSFLDSAAGRWLHFLEIVARFLAAGILGIVIYFIGASNFAPEILQQTVHVPGGPHVLGFIAGFGDKFVPSIISKYNTKNYE